MKRLILSLFVLTTFAFATTINVPAGQTTIQAGLSAASTGDTVLVQPGTYTENIIWPETNGIKLISAGDSSNTIIDGGGISSVITFTGLYPCYNTVIKGFGITNGIQIAGSTSEDGAGILIKNVGPKISNCHIYLNAGTGIYTDGDSTLILKSNVSYNNVNFSNSSNGGGIDSRAEQVHIDSCIISYNQRGVVNDWGSGGGAAGISLRVGNSKITNCTISNNKNIGGTYYPGGGGITLNGNGHLVDNNIIIFNSGPKASAIFCAITGLNGSDATIKNNLVYNNSDNAAISSWNYSNPHLIGNTIANNGTAFEGSYTTFRHNAIINNDYIGNGATTIDTCTIYNNRGSLDGVNINWSNFGLNLGGISGSSTFDGENNYWGHSTGPFHATQNTSGLGDTVTYFGDILPFLESPSIYAPPIPVQNVQITSSGYNYVNLSWDASDIGDLSGYKVYYDTDTTGYPYANSVDVSNVTTYNLTGLNTGSPYYIAVTTYDTDGNESWYSAEAQATPVRDTLNVPASYSTIQSALTAASEGDVVLVQPGTYTENINWPETNGIKLISAGDSSNTIIDGNESGPVIRIVLSNTEIDTNTIIQGFQVMNGSSSGVLLNNASPKLFQLLVINNSASGITLDSSNPVIEQSSIINNTAGNGGGIYCYSSDPVINNCVISANSAGGGGASGGGGVFNRASGITIRNSVLSNNSGGGSWNSGGGAICNYSGTTNLENVIISGNTANVGTGTGGGGGIYAMGGSVIGDNIIVYNNSTNQNGGGMRTYSGSISISNSTIVNNHAEHAGGGAFNHVTMDNVTLAYNHSIDGGGGADVDRDMINVTVVGNTANNGADGIQSGSSNISNSNILSNEEGLVNGDVNNTINAIYNYWGHVSGPYHESTNSGGQGSIIIGYVNFDPWLTEPNIDAPPIPAQNVTVNSTGNDFVSLKWDTSLLGDLAGYKLYYDSDSSGYPYANSVDVGTDTSYTLSSLSLGTTYYLAVTTYDTDGNESWYSNEVSGVTRIMQAQSLDIGGDENLQHMVNHTPSITFGYYDSMNETQTSYQIQVSTQSDYSSADMWDSGEVTSSDTSVTYAGTTLADGVTYYVRAKVGAGSFYSNWSTLTFRMNTEPTTPVLASPINNQVSGIPVILKVLNATDAESDAITYSYNLYSDIALTTKLDSTTAVTEGTDTTSWQITATLPDNGQYFWAVSTNDGYEESTVSTAASFLLNISNDAPAAFALLAPADSAEVTTLTPLLDWASASDPDPIDTVRYTLYLDTPDPGVTIVSVDTATSYQVSISLSDNTTYYWKVVANDLNGASTENTGGYHSFRVNTANDLPGDFALLSPENGSMVTDLTPTLHWEEPDDPDDGRSNTGMNHMLTEILSNDRTNSRSITSYYVYVDTTSSLTGVIPDTVTTNSYTPTVNLLEDALYYWKVEAVDDDGGVTSSAMWSFWTNGENSDPNAFALVAPVDDSVLTTLTPSFIWHSSSDADIGDQVSYSLELGAGIDSLSIVYEGSDTTFTSTTELSDNTTYYWRVIAADLSGATTANTGGYWSFRVNTENDLPSDFALLSPENGSMVTDLTPTLHWEVPVDPDDGRSNTGLNHLLAEILSSDRTNSRSITSYYVYIDTTSNLTGVIADTVTENSYTATTELAEDAMYYWKVVAVDNDGGTTESSTWSFWTNNSNSTPNAFTLLTPTEDEETGLTPTFSWTASSDADLNDSLAYTLRYGPTVSNLTVVSTGTQTTYTPTNDLTDNTGYVWQVLATDLSDATYSTAFSSFIVNSANDNPNAFSLISPDSGSVVSELPPLLVWSPTTDLDGDSVLFDVQLNGTSIGMTHHNYYFVDSLAEDMTYTWSVTATDNNGGSTQSGTWSFIVNTENVPPAPFALLSPEAETVFNTQSVFFEWETSTDSDPMDSVNYSLDVHIDTTHMHYDLNTTSFTSDGLTDNSIYHWSVTADDMNGGTTENTGGPRMFVINTANEPPSASTLVAPLNGSIQTDLTPNFYWTEAVDPDPLDHVSYTINWWPLGVLPFINSINTDSTGVSPDEDIPDNAQIGWMVVANDMYDSQSSSDTSYFYSDAFPEPPLNFATVSPENNVEGLATEVEFVWEETDDPDPVEEISYRVVYASDWEDSSTYVYSETIEDTSMVITLGDNSQYYWLVEAMDSDGFIVGSNNNTSNVIIVGTLAIDGDLIPVEFALRQNYPNPFNPVTTLRYDLPEQTHVNITVYDMLGRKVRTILNQQQDPGYKSIIWDATNDYGKSVSAGIYLYQIQAGEYMQTKKMVLLK